jgi:sensor histidine kinase YesM
MKMKSKSAKVLFHIIGCTIFLLLPFIFWRDEGGISEFFNDDRAMRGYMNNVLMLLFFYLIFYLLIPKLYFQKKYFYFGIIILLCYFIITLVPEIILPFHGHGNPPPGLDSPPPPGSRWQPGGGRILFKLGHNLVFFLAVIFFSLMLKIYNRWKQAEKEKLKAELSYFKAQINPHFLFNTLNTIYSLAIQKADNTPEAVVKLSGMMRYVISDASEDFVPLEKEISYITDYIDLQKIRFGDTVTIDYKPCDTLPGKYIAPLILIPFIENAFKFGINPEAESKIEIALDFTGKDFHMRVFNNKVIQPESNGVGGLGIINAQQRLALLYPDNHRLIIDDKEKEFTVDLYINLP